MNSKLKISFTILSLLTVVLLMVPLADAARPVAKVSGFKGEAIIQSGRSSRPSRPRAGAVTVTTVRPVSPGRRSLTLPLRGAIA